MKRSAEIRTLIAVAAGGNYVPGTYHRSQDDRSLMRADLLERNRIGVMFLNPGFQPRSGHGDSAVYWADSFAEAGYPSFRFDLPGLGDSHQTAPENLLDFIHAGGFAPLVSGLIKAVVEQYGLAGVVIMALCAGAVTALHAAAVSQDCKGVILLDPYFFLRAERTKIRNEFTRWASWSRLAGLTGDLYDVLRNIRLMVRGNRLPKNANLPLIQCWTQLASAGTPMLVLRAPAYKAPDTKPRMGDFDYFLYLEGLSRPCSGIAVEFVQGTNHSFADGPGRAAVRMHGGQWLNTHFPLSEREHIVASDLRQGA